MNARRVPSGKINAAEFKLTRDDRIRIKVELPDPTAPRRRLRDFEDDPGYVGMSLPF